MSSDAPVSDITSAIQQHGVTQAPSTYKGPVPLSYANGGLLSFYDKPRGYATGATVTALTPAQQQIVQNISKAIADGTVTQAQIDKLNKIEANTGKDVSPYVSTGTSPVTNKVTAAAISNATAAYNASPAGQQATSDQAAINTAMQNAGMTPSDAIQGQAGFQGLGAYDPVTHTWQVTNPAFQQVQSNLNQMQTAPSQYGQATNLYNQAASGLGGLTNYQPQQVSAQQISAPTASALTASAQGYGASSMQAPEAAQAKDYEAALMQGPGSWTDPGVAQKYMNPYEQGVIDIAKREKGRDYAKQLNALNAQAASAGAFGGGRQAMETSQASRDYQQQLQDLETQGLSQAYQQGMAQYGTEAALGQQARQSNQAAINAQRSQYVNNALQAAMQAYGGQLTAAQQNMIAQNAAAQFNAAAQNQASLTNAQLGTNVNLANSQNALAALQSNQQAALNAALANQNAGLQGANLGLNAYNSMGNMAQGLGALGTNIGNYNLNLTNQQMGLGQQYQNMYTNAANQNQTNASNVLQAPINIGGAGVQLPAGLGSGSTGSTAVQANTVK